MQKKIHDEQNTKVLNKKQGPALTCLILTLVLLDFIFIKNPYFFVCLFIIEFFALILILKKIALKH